MDLFLINLKPRAKSSQLKPYLVVHVNTEAEMNSCAQELSSHSHIALDSEYLPKVCTGLDTITDVIQLCGHSTKVFGVCYSLLVWVCL